MKTFTLEHKHCGQTTTVVGKDIYAACQDAKLNYRYWKVVSVTVFDN